MKKLLPLLFVCLLLCGCSRQVQATAFHMNTVMTMELQGRDAQKAQKALDKLFKNLENTWSATRSDSLLSKMNRGKSVRLSEEESALLEQVNAISQRTGGAFDPTMLALSQTWGFGTASQSLPSPDAIAAAMDEDQLDLGGALKGYAGDKAVELLDEMKIDRALLNLGGNIQTYGVKADGTPWNVGIQNPDGDNYVGVISVTGTAAIVTSGDYQRYFEQDGVHYHHILDPETGFPADSGLRSVTVICRNGLTADCLSTALFVMGLEEGSAFWRANSDFEAVFITQDGKIHVTEGVSITGCTYKVINR